MDSSNELKYRGFSIGEIKLATNEFSDQNFLEVNAFGKIYRGNIRENDHDCVVSMNRFDKAFEITLRKEIGPLSLFYHGNIISLLGLCDEEDEKILVYEFMPNGSLYSYLFNNKDGRCNLTVKQRLEICIGAANGLSLLHFGTQPCIIHGDVSTNNIFLDGNFVAKLLVPQLITSSLEGTEGYAPPECYESNYIPTPKADVYAFGVLLLELLCERPAWKTLIVLALPSIINGVLPAFIPEHVRANITLDSSRACANLIMACLDNDPNKRPSMVQVRNMLLIALKGLKLQLPRQNVDESFLWSTSEKWSFRLADIKMATNDFAFDKLIEVESVWKSYRGNFSGKKYNVCVKRINKELGEFRSHVFSHEVEMLARCNHVNVMSLLGYCHEENEYIILYNSMPNCSLHHYLYNNQHDAARLTLKQRLDICMCVAHGLSYLHTKNIIHGYFSTFKIFLDHDLVPSISGMDTAFGNTGYHIRPSYINYYHQGKEGYSAPECFEPGYKLSEQADVYAFGILFMELLCEKPSWKSVGMLALEFAKKGELPSIRHEPAEISISGKCSWACENIIRDCLNVDPDTRPSMKQVVDNLESALNLQKNNQNGKANSQQSSQPSLSSPCQSFLLSDIKRATEDFSDSNYLGEGAFGKVYRGNIFGSTYNGVVAVKRMTMNPKQGDHAFNKEIQLVSACKHINIISLVGFCSEEPEKLLIYELMPNGSLFDYLHKKKDCAAKLTIEQRLEICIGVAKGLDYLHNRTDYVIIHSDIKTDNILLDQNLVPKISDFGLSRTRDAGPSASNQVTKHIQGTEGYLAPECRESNYQLSRKADVYTYGVVLLEVLCEGRAWENLVNSALKFIREEKLPDYTPDYVARHISTRCSRACERLIMECLDTNPVKRPDMNQVVTKLEEALRLEKKYSEDHLLPFTDPNVFSSSSDHAVLYHRSEWVLSPGSDYQFLDEDFEALMCLEIYGKRVDDRNVLLDPIFTKQLENIFGWRKYSLPQLFIGGKHIGGMRTIRKLDNDGTLQGMFAKLPDRDYASPCVNCNNTRFVECVPCIDRISNSEGKKCANGDYKECNEKGLIRCPICCSWQRN